MTKQRTTGPTSERAPRSATAWVAVMTGLVVLGAGLISVVRWTLIPAAIDSRVESTSWVDSTTGHLRTLKLTDGRSLVVGRELLERAGGPPAFDGATIRKARWERSVHIDNTEIPLPVTADMWRTVAAIVFLVAFGWWLRTRIRLGTPTVDPGSGRHTT